MADHEKRWVPANQRLVNQGGLMRCCLQTLYESEEPTKVGDVIGCKFSGDRPHSLMEVGPDGVWKWHREDTSGD